MGVSPRRKSVFARPLGEFVVKELDPLVARQGFGEASLLMQWPEIVGARIAALCAPERLQWPRGHKAAPGKSRGEATLALRVEPGFGLEIQHMAPAIIDRVNAHLGWRCVARVTLRQRALGQVEEKKRSGLLRTDPAARARAEAIAEGVGDSGLRAALERLGEQALAARGD